MDQMLNLIEFLVILVIDNVSVHSSGLQSNPSVHLTIPRIVRLNRCVIARPTEPHRFVCISVGLLNWQINCLRGDADCEANLGTCPGKSSKNPQLSISLLLKCKTFTSNSAYQFLLLHVSEG